MKMSSLFALACACAFVNFSPVQSAAPAANGSAGIAFGVPISPRSLAFGVPISPRRGLTFGVPISPRRGLA